MYIKTNRGYTSRAVIPSPMHLPGSAPGFSYNFVISIIAHFAQSVTKVIDDLHIKNHRDDKCQAKYHPKKVKENHPDYNLMCAEQVFAWLSRFKRITCSMNKTHHCFFIHRIVKRRNQYQELCAQLERSPLLPSIHCLHVYDDDDLFICINISQMKYMCILYQCAFDYLDYQGYLDYQATWTTRLPGYLDYQATWATRLPGLPDYPDYQGYQTTWTTRTR